MFSNFASVGLCGDAHMCVGAGVGESIQVQREHSMSCGSIPFHFHPLRTGSFIEPGGKLWASKLHDPFVSGPHRVGIIGLCSTMPSFPHAC